MSAAPLLLGYIALSVGAAVAVYRLPRFDLRSLRLWRRGAGAGEEATGGLPDLLDRPDLGAALNLLVILGAALAVLVGWRIPAEIERIYGAGASFGLLFPSVEMTTLGRAAQVVGAVAFGAVALRLLRVLVVFAACGLALLLAVAALDYVFRLGIWF